jgi:hypothetical protein
MAKDPMKKTDMDRAYGVANAMSGYSGPSTAKQQQKMAGKYDPAPEGKELYTIKGGEAVYKTKEEIAALDKNIPDYSNPNDRAEINYQQKEAVRKNESQQAANMRESPNADARFLQTLSRLNARPNRTSAAEPTQTPPPDLQKIAKESRAANASPFTKGPVRWPIGQSPPPSVQDFGGLALSKPQAGSNKPSIFGGRDVTNMPFSERQLWDKNVPPDITGVDSNGLLISNEVAYDGRDKTKDNAWIEDYYKKNPPNLTGFQPANDNGVVLRGLLNSSNK